MNILVTAYRALIFQRNCLVEKKLFDSHLIVRYVQKNIFLRRDGTENNVHNAIDDSAKTDSFISARTRERMHGLATWRFHTVSDGLTFQSVSECSLNVDKVSQFSLRPYELRKSFPQTRDFY